MVFGSFEWGLIIRYSLQCWSLLEFSGVVTLAVCACRLGRGWLGLGLVVLPGRWTVTGKKLDWSAQFDITPCANYFSSPWHTKEMCKSSVPPAVVAMIFYWVAKFPHQTEKKNLTFCGEPLYVLKIQRARVMSIKMTSDSRVHMYIFGPKWLPKIGLYMVKIVEHSR